MVHIQHRSRLTRAGTRQLNAITSVFMDPFPVTSVVFMEVRHNNGYFILDLHSASHSSPGLSPLWCRAIVSFVSLQCRVNGASQSVGRPITVSWPDTIDLAPLRPSLCPPSPSSTLLALPSLIRIGLMNPCALPRPSEPPVQFRTIASKRRPCDRIGWLSD
jgi:hypothetical protein